MYCPFCESFDVEIETLELSSAELDENDNLWVHADCKCYSCEKRWRANVHFNYDESQFMRELTREETIMLED